MITCPTCNRVRLADTCDDCYATEQRLSERVNGDDHALPFAELAAWALSGRRVVYARRWWPEHGIFSCPAS